MIDQHLGRRSVSNLQRGLLALRKSELMAEQRTRALATRDADPADDVPGAPEPASPAADKPAPERLTSREAIAKAARLTSSQVVMIEKIQKQAAPEVVAAVRSGTISINAAAGADELKQAAKRVRESKRKPREPEPATDDTTASDPLEVLRQRLAELTAENQALRLQVAQLQTSLAN